MIERRPYSRHGLNALKARVKVRGLGAIDRRTVAARALIAWRTELLTDLGGPASVSSQQRAIVELAVRTKLYLDTVDAWIMEQPSLVMAKRRALLPVVRERQQLADALARYMTALGLERKSKPAQSLQEYLAVKASQRGHTGSGLANGTAVRSDPPPDPSVVVDTPDGLETNK